MHKVHFGGNQNGHESTGKEARYGYDEEGRLVAELPVEIAPNHRPQHHAEPRRNGVEIHRKDLTAVLQVLYHHAVEQRHHNPRRKTLAQPHRKDNQIKSPGW